MPNYKTAIIIGAGPAGLTAAYELLTRTDIKPIIIEKSEYLGGISRTIQFQGNRMDLGGHRFFTKSPRVNDFWLNILPLENQSPPQVDQTMLVCQRKSRIYFLKKLFDYPLNLNLATLKRLGWKRTIKITFSYLKSLIRPIKPEKNLEDFFINRFGRELYQTFFQAYTEKLWGKTCQEISPEWGTQRVKGVSIISAIKHALGLNKTVETSLIETFLYPKLGPGQMWETVAQKIISLGGKIITPATATTIYASANQIAAVGISHHSGRQEKLTADYFFSSMPVKDLVAALEPPAPPEIKNIAAGLCYRDFLTVGLLLKKIRLEEKNGELIRDNWLYIQEPGVKLGRVQIFNNWSPYLVANPNTVWLGLEYFCSVGDDLWIKSDAEVIKLAQVELEQIGFITEDDILTATVARMEKAYPAYFGSYNQFPKLQKYLDRFTNLFPIGRNGLHKYNNQDHSMLTAMTAIDNIINNRPDKSNIWAVNTEKDYHE
jgi:protoporphyrinogen oxidase